MHKAADTSDIPLATHAEFDTFVKCALIEMAKKYPFWKFLQDPNPLFSQVRLSHFRAIVARNMGVDMTKLLPNIKLHNDSMETFGKKTPTADKNPPQISSRVTLNLDPEPTDDDVDKDSFTISSQTILSTPEKT